MRRRNTVAVLQAQGSKRASIAAGSHLIKVQGLKRAADSQVIKDPVEKAFVASLQSAEAYVRLEQDLSELVARGGLGGSGLNEDDFDSLLQPFIRTCWEASERTFAKNGENDVFAAARAEVVNLKKQLKECNLACMKQITGFKAGKHSSSPLGDDEVIFFEPLQHLDSDTRELVFLVAAEKVRQLQDGTAPNSLMTSICQAIDDGGKTRRRTMSCESSMELADKNAELQEQLDRLQQRVQAAEQKNEVVREQADNRLAQVQKELADLQAEVERHQQEAAERTTELEEVRSSLGSTTAALREAESGLSQLREELEASKARENDFQVQLASDRQALQVEVEKGKAAAERVAELEVQLKGAGIAQQRVQELEAERRELQKRAFRFEQEAEDLRKELESMKRNSSTDAVGKSLASDSQTGAPGDLEDENRRLKVALEELRAKLDDLMAGCKKSGISHELIDSIADNCGLKPLMKARSVFEHLYKDALLRVERLEKLKEKYRQEKLMKLGLGKHPNAHQNALAALHMDSSLHNDMSVLEAVQHSDLSEALFPSGAAEHFAARRPRHYDSPPAAKPPVSVSTMVDPQVPAVAPFSERGLSTLQRAQSLRAQSQTQTFQGAAQLMKSLENLANGGGVSSQRSGRSAPFAPSPADLSADAGKELAERLAASTSLPSLNRQLVPTGSIWAQGRDGGVGGTLVPNVGRDGGWR